MSDGKMVPKMDQQIGGVYTVLQYQTIVGNRELSQKEKLTIHQSIYVPTLTYCLELWVVTERMRLWIEVTKMKFICWVKSLKIRIKCTAE